MNENLDFEKCFECLTGHQPMSWQRRLYEEWFLQGNVPPCLTIPTGLGKTSVIHIWLIALANSASGNDASRLPRRLVYVVNRRTIVDQATREAETLRENLAKVGQMRDRLLSLCAVDVDVASPLAISTLRGQLAEIGEWSADPARPAIIVGTVDMIGSRLLFSGYGRGFKSRPLHAGFLGQDALVIHDEAHLEPAFQKLLDEIKGEQVRCTDFRPFGVMAMTATSGTRETPFTLIEDDYRDEIVRERVEAKKTIAWYQQDDEKKTADQVAERAVRRAEEHPDSAILVFVRKVDDVKKVVDLLKNKKKGNVSGDQIQTLTGTLRGLKRDELVKTPVFQRFLREPNRDKSEEPAEGTVYLVCTSAGEVGIDISADHLVCDLAPFDSMAQRFGRVNRFGDGHAMIDIVHPVKFEEKNEYDIRRQKTLDLLQKLDGNGSPKSLGTLPKDECIAAFTPSPTILPATGILFDAWALTTIRKKLPGRPPVEPYLHGISEWDPPETRVAWRDEVRWITGDLLEEYKPKDLLEDYPLKPHEWLRDRSDRVFKSLQRLAKEKNDVPVWIIDDRDEIRVTTLGDIASGAKYALNSATVLLAPQAGGLSNGMLDGTAGPSVDGSEDVADRWLNEDGKPRRVRVWSDNPVPDAKVEGMPLVRPPIDIRPDADEGDDEASQETPSQGRYWHWFELPRSGDGDGSRYAKGRVCWRVHTREVAANVERIVRNLPVTPEIEQAVILAARFHDLGKKRELWQRSIGNPDYPTVTLAKSDGRSGGFRHPYRHEFGSLLDILDEPAFQKLSEGMRDLVLHIIAAHHGRARPHFTVDEAFDAESDSSVAAELAREVPRRFARLQRKYGRWGLAYLESLLRAADWAASADPSRTEGKA